MRRSESGPGGDGVGLGHATFERPVPFPSGDGQQVVGSRVFRAEGRSALDKEWRVADIW